MKTPSASMLSAVVGARGLVGIILAQAVVQASAAEIGSNGSERTTPATPESKSSFWSLLDSASHETQHLVCGLPALAVIAMVMQSKTSHQHWRIAARTAALAAFFSTWLVSGALHQLWFIERVWVSLAACFFTLLVAELHYHTEEEYLRPGSFMARLAHIFLVSYDPARLPLKDLKERLAAYDSVA